MARKVPSRQEPSFTGEFHDDPDGHTAQRHLRQGDEKGGLPPALERKYEAEAELATSRTTLTQGQETRKTSADAERALAEAELALSRAIFVEGPETKKALADARKSLADAKKALADAQLAQTRAAYVSGPETRKTEADAELSKSRSIFVDGVETDKTRADAGLSSARSEYIKQVEVKKGMAEIEQIEAQTRNIKLAYTATKVGISASRMAMFFAPLIIVAVMSVFAALILGVLFF